MTTTIASTTQFGPGSRIVLLFAGDNAVVEERVQIGSDNAWTVIGTGDYRLVLAPDSGVYAFGPDIINNPGPSQTISQLSAIFGFADVDLVVGEGAIVDALEDGIRTEGDLDMSNQGLVRGGQYGAFVGADAAIHNVGSIRGGLFGVHIEGAGEVLNEGSITGGDAAIQTVGGLNITNAGRLFAAEAIVAASSPSIESIDLVNTGEITGSVRAANIFNVSATILNEGVIVGQRDGAAALLFGVSQGNEGVHQHEVVNTGRILSEGLAIKGGGAEQRIDNAGVISGDIALGGGDDLYRGRNGRVEGTVSGEDGRDTLIGGDEANVVRGGAQNDVIRGRGGNDDLDGEGGADLVNGGAGDDLIRGGFSADRLLGKSGDDEIYGDQDPDRMFGGKGDDVMYGGNFSDTMFGGRGDDTLGGGNGFDVLHGGRGDDQLSGGAASDTFVLKRLSDDDLITDFQNGMDVIDLTAFGLRPAQFVAVVAPALNDAGGGATFLDLAQLGGNGSVLIQGLAFGQADASDFVL